MLTWIHFQVSSFNYICWISLQFIYWRGAPKPAVYTGKPTSWTDFLVKAKSCRPTLDMNADHDWLMDTYKNDLNKRLLELKSKVVRAVQYHARDTKHPLKPWESITSKASELNFGFSRNMDIRVVKSLLLILGYEVSTELRREKKSHIKQCITFLIMKLGKHTNTSAT